MDAFSASVAAKFPLSDLKRITVGDLWWLNIPPANAFTLSHAVLGVCHIECIRSDWCEDQTAFAREMLSVT